MRYHLTLVRMAILKKSTNNKYWRGCGEKRTLLHCWWECKLVQPLGRIIWRFLKKLKIELPYEIAIPFLSIYPEKNVAWKDTYIPMFIAALFTITKTWKQVKYPLTEEWIKKTWYIYHSTIKRNEIRPFAATWMDLESVILSVVSKTEKEKYHMTSLICGIQKEVIQINLLTKQKETHRLRKWTHGFWGERIVKDFEKVMSILLYLKWIMNKIYCTAHGTQLNVMWQPGWEGAWEKWIHVWLSPYCSPETITTYPNEKHFWY